MKERRDRCKDGKAPERRTDFVDDEDREAWLLAIVRRPVGNSPVGPDASPSLPALSWLGYFGGALLGGVQGALHIGLPFLAAALLTIAAGAFAMRRA